MCAYTKINGVYGCENPTTLRGFLDTIGFTGFTMTDYGAAHTTAGSLAGGVDIETGNKDAYSDHLLQAVQNGSVPVSRLDQSVYRILFTMFRIGLFDHPTAVGPIDVAADDQVALRTEEQAITLLKNNNNALPLTKKAKKIAVIGADANMIAIGGGTPFVQATESTSALQGILDRAGQSHASVTWTQGNDQANGANMLESSTMTAVPSSVLSPTSGVGTGLNAYFWKDPNFQGSPDQQRIAPQVNYDVGILSTLDTPGPSQVTPPPVICATCPGSAVYDGHITAPKTGAYKLALTGMGDATLDIDGQRVATMTGADGVLAYGETPTLNWVAGHSYTLHVTFKGDHPFEILNDGSVLLEWKTPAKAYSPAIKQAVAAAKKSDVAIVYVNTIEGEAHDRVSLKLPQSDDQLIEAVSAVNKHTIVVMANAGPVTMPWLNKVAAVVETYYGGQEQGAALAHVLWGDVNPSGKLTVTYPTTEKAVPSTIVAPYAGAANPNVVYGEGIDVGYKDYDVSKITPQFPFGYGLSYSTFRYGHLNVSCAHSAKSLVHVRFTITNTSRRSGDEIAQVYVGLPKSTGEPPKRLIGYERVSTTAGHSTTVELTIDPKAATHPLGYFDTGSNSWKIASGTYKIYVGGSERNTPLTASFSIA